MAEFKTLVEQGVRYQAFVAQGAPAEIEALRRDEEKTTLPGFISPALGAQIASLHGRFTLLVAAEMWCPDCQRNLPALAALCQRYPHAELSIITREQASPTFTQHFAVERVKIPFVAVLDADLQPLGALIERPQSVVSGGDDVLASYKRGERLADTISDVVAIMQRSAG